MESTSMESILCEAIRLEFEAQAPLACAGTAGGGGSSSRALNDAESAKLEELVVANKALHAPLDEDVSQLAAAAPTPAGTHDPELINIVNLTAVAIRRLIKMAKKISAFRNLCEEDQVALLKGGCIEMMVLRSTMNYDGQKNSWHLPYSDDRFSTVPADVLKKAKGNIYQAHDRFIRSFEPRWRQDERLVLLLSAISLFVPERARVVHADVVRLEQHAYYYLLRRYLESVYPGCEAKATFLKLIQKVRELRRLAEEVTGVYLDVNPLEPLLIEIFDLKHRAAHF
ncbi:Nuclear hormone receptor HR96 [Eumeta japonica]|uniref:Nuclear hormone receptor HR96 n=1 Tax=Eumeta variegata TaxID=151549 RepID=A0A4C1ZMN3_EUMVA|nr:Nuclear hormone receptor HR96 [Eumeta japonica]